ncbi:MAG: polysaccharide deacetylase family protein [Clostridiales bacterium]|nr:polysaccharide deacetylase family protein [Clostridiales bacterium]
MKRILPLLLVVLLVLPMTALAAEEKLPRLDFPANNYVGYSGYDFYLQMDVRSAGNLKTAKSLELRDETGRVWAVKDFKPWASSFSFKIPLDKSFEGGATLSVWYGDTQVSIDTAYVAVTDRHLKVIQTVDTDEPFMSLSFDCAYVETPTDELLALLDELNIKATFFMTGEFVLNFPESAKKIRDAGHEIGAHSLSHPHLLEKPLDTRFKQVRRNVEIIRETLGVNPRLFRPPFGEFDVTVSAPARAEGMEVCMWTIDSMDWDWDYSKEMVYKRVTKNVGPGTIILFHLDGYHTIDVVREAVPYYRDTLGLELIPITELVALSGRELPPCPYEE